MSEADEAWPFENWFRLAVLQMHIMPESFWNMTVRDWLTLIRPLNSTKISTADFQDLFSNFPDEEVQNDFNR